MRLPTEPTTMESRHGRTPAVDPPRAPSKQGQAWETKSPGLPLGGVWITRLEASLVQSLGGAGVESRLSEARGRRSTLLWTPGSNPVTAVVEALADYVSGLQGRHSRSQAAVTVEEAAQLLLREETGITEAALAEAVDELAGRIRERLQKFSIKTRNELGLLFVLDVILRLTQAGALSSSACAALTLSINRLDDAVAQSMSGVIYSLRPLILFKLAEVALCLQEEVRHTDDPPRQAGRAGPEGGAMDAAECLHHSDARADS
jgi:hypothetical protein